MDNETANRLIEVLNKQVAQTERTYELDSKFLVIREKELLDSQQIKVWQEAIDNRDKQLEEYASRLDIAAQSLEARDMMIARLMGELKAYKKIFFDKNIPVPKE